MMERIKVGTLVLAALFLALVFRLAPAAGSVPEPAPGPAVRVISALAGPAEPDPGPPPEVHVIEDCTVTWYTADTCGKSPEHPAYGVTASGLPVEEGVTCAVDPEIIPLYSTVWVAHADGRLERLQATDTGVTGAWVDIYTPDHDYAVQCGLQQLTVYWMAPKE